VLTDLGRRGRGRRPNTTQSRPRNVHVVSGRDFALWSTSRREIAFTTATAAGQQRKIVPGMGDIKEEVAV
jgi:hypothetical protein